VTSSLEKKTDAPAKHSFLTYPRWILWFAAIVTGLLQAWAFRHGMRSDGISYLDIAWKFARGDWHALVNAYWSPLYPAILGVTFRILKPSLYWESTVAHFVNFAIFLFSFWCFELFLKELIRNQQSKSAASADSEPMPAWAFWLLGDSLFVYITLLFIHLETMTPDLCVAALVFLAAAALLRIQDGNGRFASHAALGVILGFAYLAKAVMFPLGFIFAACCLLAGKPPQRAIPRTIVALFVFLLVCAPFLVALSKSKGRLTFGDAGRVSYAVFVDGSAHGIHWQGGPDGTGSPIHPTRMLLATPPVFEFATPVGGTYPPWYDASYWYEGLKPVFHLRNQLRAIRYTIEEYSGLLPFLAAPLVGFLGMALFAKESGSFFRGILGMAFLWLPGVAALALYALVSVEPRFVAPFFALIFMALFAALRFPITQTAQALVKCLALATALALGVGIAWLAGRAAFRAAAPQPFENWQVAQGLKEMGIESGDRVASIGYALDGYWAHLAGVRIVAEVPLSGTPQFWASSAGVQSQVMADFAKAGAKIVVTDQGLPLGSAPGWRPIGSTGYFAFDLRELAHPRAPGAQ
jgi:hypothetical protein